ncbi:hypothetical protein [Mesorhizobium sp.]|uniref:hypothetical protein n=1 Tax=Mesorhizobium sp. TaxID=1871066 RepID=UPI0025EE48A7|nr:hypothetical protein [Mesorhizobium sp.]
MIPITDEKTNMLTDFSTLRTRIAEVAPSASGVPYDLESAPDRPALLGPRDAAYSKEDL